MTFEVGKSFFSFLCRFFFRFKRTSPLEFKKKKNFQDAISTLKRAARRAWAVPASDTLAAILVVEKAKLIADGDTAWLEEIAGGPQVSCYVFLFSGFRVSSRYSTKHLKKKLTKKQGRRWRLMFTSGTDQVRKAVAGGKAGGTYIPITAVQRWRLSDKLIENGIYLGALGAFVFSGTWEAKGKRLSFDFYSVRLRLCPWSKDFAMKGKKAEEEAKSGGAKKSLGPFFLFAYADDDICVARGRGGGVALWARAAGDWQVKAGIDDFA